MWEQKSNTLFADYFDALTVMHSDHADFENIHAKLMADFEYNVSRAAVGSVNKNRPNLKP